MKRTALMKLASICRVVRVAILSGVTLFPSIFNEAIAEISSEEDAAVNADARLIRVEEFRALEASVAGLGLQLAAQQELIASQQKDIDRQRRVLQSVLGQAQKQRYGQRHSATNTICRKVSVLTMKPAAA